MSVACVIRARRRRPDPAHGREGYVPCLSCDPARGPARHANRDGERVGLSGKICRTCLEVARATGRDAPGPCVSCPDSPCFAKRPIVRPGERDGAEFGYHGPICSTCRRRVVRARRTAAKRADDGPGDDPGSSLDCSAPTRTLLLQVFAATMRERRIGLEKYRARWPGRAEVDLSSPRATCDLIRRLWPRDPVALYQLLVFGCVHMRNFRGWFGDWDEGRD